MGTGSGSDVPVPLPGKGTGNAEPVPTGRRPCCRSLAATWQRRSYSRFRRGARPHGGAWPLSTTGEAPPSGRQETQTRALLRVGRPARRRRPAPTVAMPPPRPGVPGPPHRLREDARPNSLRPGVSISTRTRRPRWRFRRTRRSRPARDLFDRQSDAPGRWSGVRTAQAAPDAGRESPTRRYAQVGLDFQIRQPADRLGRGCRRETLSKWPVSEA